MFIPLISLRDHGSPAETVSRRETRFPEDSRHARPVRSGGVFRERCLPGLGAAGPLIRCAGRYHLRTFLPPVRGVSRWRRPDVFTRRRREGTKAEQGHQVDARVLGRRGASPKHIGLPLVSLMTGVCWTCSRSAASRLQVQLVAALGAVPLSRPVVTVGRSVGAGRGRSGLGHPSVPLAADVQRLCWGLQPRLAAGHAA